MNGEARTQRIEEIAKRVENVLFTRVSGLEQLADMLAVRPDNVADQFLKYTIWALGQGIYGTGDFSPDGHPHFEAIVANLSEFFGDDVAPALEAYSRSVHDLGAHWNPRESWAH